MRLSRNSILGFENFLQQIPRSHHPKDKYLVYLYTNALLVQLGFLLSKKGPRTIQEAYHMAIQIEANISLFKGEHLFTPEIKVDDPKDTPDTLSLERLVSLEIFVSKFQERREQVIDQQEVEERDPNEGFQSHEEEKEFTHASTEDNEDEALIPALPFDEVIQAFDAPAQEEVNTVSCFPFQDFDDALFCDLESKEVLEEPLDALIPSCYDEGNDMVNNIDEFIHVGRRKWDVIGYDGDPIYDIEDHFQMFPLQLSYQVTTNSDIWQQGNDIVTDISKGDLVLCSPDDFRSYLEDFDEYSFEHLDLFYEEYYQPPLCSDLDKGEDIACPKQGTCDKVFQLPSTTLPRYVTKGVVGKHVPCLEFSRAKPSFRIQG
jgi:hypothetical protein